MKIQYTMINKLILITYLTLVTMSGLLAQRPFITTWATHGSGTSGTDQITIPAGNSNSYTIYWEEVGNPGNNGTDSGSSGDKTITFPNSGIYTVEISGGFNQIYFNNMGDLQKIRSIEQWGDIAWSTMNAAFYGCRLLNINATDIPDLSNVEDMSNMLFGVNKLPNNIGLWDVSNVTNMSGTFFWTTFKSNHDISNWDISNVTNMSKMFKGLSQWSTPEIGVGSWDVSSVTNMAEMFYDARTFNENIGSWDVSNVTDMSDMFTHAINFNQDIGDWNVSNVKYMWRILTSATSFNQDLSDWNISSVEDGFGMSASGMSTTNYDLLLNSWAQSANPPSGIRLGGTTYCNATAARQYLINTLNWDISDEKDISCVKPFITIWKTNNPGQSRSDEVKIQTGSTTTFYDIYWEELNNPQNNGQIRNVWQGHTIEFPSRGTYVVEIKGDFRGLASTTNYPDREKLISIEQWGEVEWREMNRVFYNFTNLEINATDAPILFRTCDDMTEMFYGVKAFNSSLANWDVSIVNNMAGMFANSGLDQSLGNWDISNVTDMTDMLDNSALSDENYDATLIGWSNRATRQDNVNLGAEGVYYCTSEAARNMLINDTGWTITDSGFSNSCCLEPDGSATNPTALNISHESAEINWTAGNGNGRLAIARAGANVNVLPTDDQIYTASSSFGSGHHFGNGNYAVYVGNGTGFSLDNLNPSTSYYIKIFEYNEATGCIEYLTTTFADGNFTTSCIALEPTSAPTSLSFSNVADTRMTLSWNNGNGNRRMVLARKGQAVNGLPQDGNTYTANSTFGLGSSVGIGGPSSNDKNYVLYNGTGNSFTAYGLDPEATYYFSVIEYNRSVNCTLETNYLTSTILSGSANTLCNMPAQPTVPSSGMRVPSHRITTNSALFGWINGNGAKRIVLARANSPVSTVPVDGASYIASSSLFDAPDIGGGNRVVYISSSNGLSEFTLEGLNANTTYYIKVFEYNIDAACYLETNYLTSPSLSGSVTTKCANPEPTSTSGPISFSNVTSSSMRLSWSKGNGNRRVVIARKGSAVNRSPVDGSSYSSSSSFGNGSNLGSGNYVVYSGTGSSVTVYGLSSSSSYHYAIHEYNYNSNCDPINNYDGSKRTGSRSTTSSGGGGGVPICRFPPCPIDEECGSDFFDPCLSRISSSQNNIFVDFQSEKSARGIIQVYDLNGKVIKNINNSIYPILHHEIPVNDAKGQIYIVRVINNFKTEAKKIFLQQ
ncbi:MAG: BspA family leucine-rich repeat surface protein [Bacteroidota bacterium]